MLKKDNSLGDEKKGGWEDSLGDWKSESEVHRQCGEKKWKAVNSHAPEKIRGDAAKDTGVVFEEVNGYKWEWRGEVVNAGEERGEGVSK